jgi:hypothetical protein
MSETFTGPATIVLGEREFRLDVRLSARFEPVEGRFRWAGRATPDAALTEAFRSGAREVTVRTAAGAARPARLGEPDPWGGLRLTGTGAPPWDAA